MKNVIRLFSVVFFSVVAMATVKGQGWESERMYRIGLDDMNLSIRFPEVLVCKPLRISPEGMAGFYFEKPIYEPKFRGGEIEFNITNYFTHDCEMAEDDKVTIGKIDFKVNGITKLFISGINGNVGVNTTNPRAQFHVNGSTLITHTAGDWHTALRIEVNTDNSNAFTVINDNIAGNNKDIFRIMGNGAVSTKKVYAEAFEVTPNAMNIYWYDHVFAQDYKLRTLSELEAFIKVNKHLPEIPSEKEVRENGINLGDMQAKLLLKVEELTLYIIALEKRLAELEAKKGGE